MVYQTMSNTSKKGADLDEVREIGLKVCVT